MLNAKSGIRQKHSDAELPENKLCAHQTIKNILITTFLCFGVQITFQELLVFIIIVSKGAHCEEH